jgi:signal transduction histidine kinase
MVLPSAYLRPWRWITIALACATGLLVATALWAFLAFRRSSAALHATLVALGKDLTTPVAPPRIAELTGIADGILRMAAELLASRNATERLGRELSQKERLAALGRVAAGVAHEVRNPLASIKLLLDLTAASHPLPDAAKQAIEAASQEICRLDRLVGDLLLVAGQRMGPRRAVELGALLRARTEALEPWAASHEVALDVPSSPLGAGESTAEADPESVARAMDAAPSGVLELFTEIIARGVRGGEIARARAPHVVEVFVACAMGMSLFAATFGASDFDRTMDAFLAIVDGELFKPARAAAARRASPRAARSRRRSRSRRSRAAPSGRSAR